MLILLPFVMLGAVAGVVVTALSEPEYTSSADVFVSAPSSGSATDAADAAAYSLQQATNFAELATRQVVVLPVVDKLDLDLSAGEVQSRLSVSVPSDTSIISIRVTDTSAERAAAIANAVADSLRQVVAGLEDDAPVSLQTVEEAEPAGAASSPRPVLNVLMGILAGLCLGVGAIAVRDAARSAATAEAGAPRGASSGV